jgi:hypothetical protein
MSFFSFCRSDPLLDFIRATYGAVPLKVPDGRFKPLTLIAVQDRKARYLGTLEELATSPTWIAPKASSAELADVSTKLSQEVSWDVAVGLLAPFLSTMLETDLTPIDASLKAAAKESEGVRIAIGRARRTQLNPLGLARSIGSKTHRLPSNIDRDLARVGGAALYIVDGVLSARELTMELGGTNASDAAAALEVKLAAKVKADRLLRSTSKLVISGTNRTPFAFTCLRIDVDQQRYVSQLALEEANLKVGATSVAKVPSMDHADLGAAHELIALDN